MTTSPSIVVSRQSSAATHSNVSPGQRSVNYTLPFDATWEPDFWGRIRNTVVASTSEAQASAADLQNVRLSVEAELAFDYYQLRSLDTEKRLLDSTIVAFQEQLDLTRVRQQTGIASDETWPTNRTNRTPPSPPLNVITAQTTLLNTQRTAVNLQMQQMTASVELIKALGGGWNQAELPSPKHLSH